MSLSKNQKFSLLWEPKPYSPSTPPLWPNPKHQILQKSPLWQNSKKTPNRHHIPKFTDQLKSHKKLTKIHQNRHKSTKPIAPREKHQTTIADMTQLPKEPIALVRRTVQPIWGGEKGLRREEKMKERRERRERLVLIWGGKERGWR